MTSERIDPASFSPVAAEITELADNARAAIADPRIDDLLLLLSEARGIVADLRRLCEMAIGDVRERHLRIVRIVDGPAARGEEGGSPGV